jgi:drug/metabolite transporter (DMT)-like permease
MAYAAGLSLPSLLSTRFTIGAAMLWAWVFLVPRLRRAVADLPRRRVIGLLLWGVFGYAGQAVLFFAALRLIPASLTEVLLYTMPAFVAIITWARTGRRPETWRLAAITLALVGTTLCAGPIEGRAHAGGALLALAAAVWYASFLIALHRLTAGLPGVLSGAMIITGAAAASDLGALALGWFELPQSAAAWGALLGTVLSSTVFGFVLYVVGIKRVGPHVTSILSTFEPVGTILLAALFLGERLLPLQWAGAGLIIGAAFVLASASSGTGGADPVEAAVEQAEADANG